MTLLRFISVMVLGGALAGCATPVTYRALQYPAGQPEPNKARGRAVPVETRLWMAPTRITSDSRQAGSQMRLGQPPRTKSSGKRPRTIRVDQWQARENRTTRKGGDLVFESTDFDTNADNTGGFLFIPADPSAAAGPDHLVTVTNTSIAFHQPDGTLLESQSLADFFSALNPQTFTFDPKAAFDQYENRFVVLTLERTDVDDGDPDNTSRIFVAVSDTADPTGGWTVTAINGFETVQNAEHWVDFPGLAVDEEAIYITANLFRFFDQPDGGAFGGSRLWIIDKGLNNGFYDGRSADVTRFNPFVQGGTFAGTHQPAHVYGTPPAGNTGTWLVLFSGLFSGSQEQAQVVRVDSPLGNTSFTFDFVSLGNIDNDPTADLANLPQDNTSVTVDAGDRRTLDAVWRDDRLYFTTTITANSGPDSGETTAVWASINTQTDSLDQLGLLGGEDIRSDMQTAYPAIAVNADGMLALGFSAGHPQEFLSAWYALHFPGDADGSNRGSVLIRAGDDRYERDFGGPESRWGDYSSAVVEESSGCFWIYNKYARSRGTPTSGQDGRWGTAAAQVCNNRAPQAVADALSVVEGGNVDRTDAGEISLLSNDSDPDGDSLEMTTSAVSVPGAGSVTLQSNGRFNYQHDGSEADSDSFQYEVCDDAANSLCAVASVNVAVSEVNDPPLAVDDVLASQTESQPLISFSAALLLANDLPGPAGEDHQSLAVVSVSNPVGGGVALDGSTIEFAPLPQFNGQASFTYTVRDDGQSGGLPDPLEASAVARFEITGDNDPPVAGDDVVDAIVGVATVITASGAASLSANDSDPEVQPLVVQPAPLSGPTQGSVVLQPGGAFVYTNTSTVSGGSDAFVYRTCDGGEPTLCDDATVTINIIESPFALCTPRGRRAVVGIPVGIPAADLFADPRGNFAANQLPPSLSIDADSGVITGTPASADAAASPFFITVTSAGAPRFFFLTIDPDTDALFFSGFDGC